MLTMEGEKKILIKIYNKLIEREKFALIFNMNLIEWLLKFGLNCELFNHTRNFPKTI
jgi:hypothetical protein